MSKSEIRNPKSEIDTALDQAQNSVHLRAAAEKKAAHQAAQSEAADAYRLLGAIDMAEFQRSMIGVAQYRVLSQIRDRRLFRFLPSPQKVRRGALFDTCKTFDEFLVSVGLSKSSFYDLERQIKNFGCATAHFLQQAGVPRAIRRRLLDAPKKLKKQLDAAAESRDQQALDAILQKLESNQELVAQAREAERAAKQAEADTSRLRAQLERRSGELHSTKSKLDQAQSEIQNLKSEIETPALLRDADPLKETAWCNNLERDIEALKGQLLHAAEIAHARKRPTDRLALQRRILALTAQLCNGLGDLYRTICELSTDVPDHKVFAAHLAYLADDLDPKTFNKILQEAAS